MSLTKSAVQEMREFLQATHEARSDAFQGRPLWEGTPEQVRADLEPQYKLIAHLTDENHHGEALAHMAEWCLRERALASAIKAMTEIQHYFGHITNPLKDLRNEFYDRVKALVMHKYGPETGTWLMGAL